MNVNIVDVCRVFVSDIRRLIPRLQDEDEATYVAAELVELAVEIYSRHRSQEAAAEWLIIFVDELAGREKT